MFVANIGSGPKGTQRKKLQNLDSIRLIQETEHALIDSSVRKDYEYYNNSCDFCSHTHQSIYISYLPS